PFGSVGRDAPIGSSCPQKSCARSALDPTPTPVSRRGQVEPRSNWSSRTGALVDLWTTTGTYSRCKDLQPLNLSHIERPQCDRSCRSVPPPRWRAPRVGLNLDRSARRGGVPSSKAGTGRSRRDHATRRGQPHAETRDSMTDPKAPRPLDIDMRELID